MVTRDLDDLPAPTPRWRHAERVACSLHDERRRANGLELVQAIRHLHALARARLQRKCEAQHAMRVELGSRATRHAGAHRSSADDERGFVGDAVAQLLDDREPVRVELALRRRRSTTRDAVRLFDARHLEPERMRDVGGCEQVGCLDAAARAVSQDEQGARGGQRRDVRAGDAVRSVEVEDVHHREPTRGAAAGRAGDASNCIRMDPAAARIGAIRALVVGVVLIAAFAFFFVYPGHDPKPNGVPVAVAAHEPVASLLTDALEEDGRFEVQAVDDEDAARDAILDRDAYGAFVVGDDGTATLLVASGASLAVADLLRGVGQSIADARDVELEVTDVRKLDPGDPRGISTNLLTLATSVPAILGALLSMMFAPTLAPVARILMLGLFAIVGGLASTLIVHVGIGAIPGNFLGVWAVVSFAIFAITIASAAIITLIGPAGTGVSFMIFLMLGNPASGAAGAPELLPTLWRDGGQFLQPGAFASALRGVAYFDWAGTTGPLLVLTAWSLFGIAILLVRRPKALVAVPAP